MREIAPGTLLADKFRIESVLGRGAMGIVYVAVDIRLERRVALKTMISPFADDEQRERFVREARASATLTSEHAVRVHEIGVASDADGPLPFIVTELLEGETLEARLTRGRVPAPTAVDWIVQALDAIIEAHRKGHVHRDLKPGNLFLATRPNGAPIVKVLDFGLVKSRGAAPLTMTGDTMGTPAYMPPEQVRAARDLDARADIWALGASLYELLTGRLPFDGATTPDLVAHILRDPPAPLDAALPAALQAIVLRCLAKDPAARFASSEELRQALVTLEVIPHTLPVRKVFEPSPRSTERIAHAPTIPHAPGRDLPARPPPTPAVSAVPAAPARRASVRVFVVSTTVVLLLGLVGIVVWVGRSRVDGARGISSTATESPPPPAPSSAPPPSAPGVSPAGSDDAPIVAPTPRSSSPPQRQPAQRLSHAVLTPHSGVQPSQMGAYAARVQSALDACARAQPCQDVNVLYTSMAGRGAIKTMAAAERSCNPQFDVVACVEAAVRPADNLNLFNCTKPMCSGRIDIQFQ